MIVTLLWGFSTSLKDRYEFRTNILWFPEGWPWEWQWSNYLTAFQNFSVKIETADGFSMVYMGQMLIYTLLYAVGCSFCGTFVSCVVAYLVAKFPYKFSKVIYAIVIVTMILPIIGSMPSEIQIARMLNLYDHIWGMWIMKAHFLGMHFLVFYGVFKSTPNEYSEAAKVDGAGNLSILFRIFFPLVRNTFFTLMLLSFIGYWNDYQLPLIYTPSYPTLAYGLYLFNFSAENQLSSVPMRLAGCMILMIPIFVIFLIFHNRLIGNVSIGGLKE